MVGNQGSGRWWQNQESGGTGTYGLRRERPFGHLVAARSSEREATAESNVACTAVPDVALTPIGAIINDMEAGTAIPDHRQHLAIGTRTTT